MSKAIPIHDISGAETGDDLDITFQHIEAGGGDPIYMSGDVYELIVVRVGSTDAELSMDSDTPTANGSNIEIEGAPSAATGRIYVTIVADDMSAMGVGVYRYAIRHVRGASKNIILKGTIEVAGGIFP